VSRFFVAILPFRGDSKGRALNVLWNKPAVEALKRSEMRSSGPSLLWVGDSLEAAGNILQQLKRTMYFANFRSVEGMGKDFERRAALTVDRDHS
jgi:hypothetical protein